MKLLRLFLLAGILLCPCLNLQSQQYTFNGTMSEEVLYNYLDRAITMQGQSDLGGPLHLTELERQANISMLLDIGAKFVGRISGWWENYSSQLGLDNTMALCATNVADLKAQDPEIICQAAIFEHVSATVGNFDLPQYVLTRFSQPGPPRKFRYADMLYPGHWSQYMYHGNPMDSAQHSRTPDITQIETQMWFYYLATRYIDIGIEAIHFGQAELMNQLDVNTGHASWWDLLTKIRQYAATKNRGVILCDAHLVTTGGLYYDPNPEAPLPDAQRQLVFDFHSSPITFERAENCQPNQQPAIVKKYPGKHIYGRSKGGINPLGWFTHSNNFLVEFDNGGIDTNAQGCGAAPSHFLWGWDEISWFSNQSQTYRNDILEYTWYKVKCLDPKAHLEMPGMREYFPIGNHTTRVRYQCNTGIFNAQTTIRDIWNGVFNQYDWTPENFTNTKVSNPPATPHVSSDLVLVGTDKMYYIATDGTIHGYILDAGTWVTVSPSWDAHLRNQTPIGNQVDAAGDLVASLDGQKLFYRGVDGFLHGFNILNSYNYDYEPYSDLKTMLLAQNLRMHSCLVPHDNNRLYYIGHELGTGSFRVHAFVNPSGSWTTNSPSWSADANGTPIINQTQAAGGLALSPDGTKLVYIGVDEFMRGFNVQNFWSYTYDHWSDLETKLTTQVVRVDAELTFANNKAIYYIAREITKGNARRIHGFVKHGGSWTTVSPSHASAGTPAINQEQASGELVVNPSGNKLMYRGYDSQLYGFDILSKWSYAYIDPALDVSQNAYLTNSLVMAADDEIYYISNPWLPVNRDVHVYRLGTSPCTNPEIFDVEPDHDPQNNKRGTPGEMIQSRLTKPQGLEIWPNPAQQEVTLRLNAGAKQATIRILDIQGRTVLKTGTVSLENNQWQQKLDLSQLRPGLYMVNATAGTESWTKKLIVR